MEPIESRINYQFNNPLLLIEALTHPSQAYESKKANKDNQRFEFLGDAVLQLIITEELFHKFPDFPEGQLTKLRSRLVSRKALATFALKLDLGSYILLGKSEDTPAGRKRQSTLADVFESLIGGIYLDSDLETARSWVLTTIGVELEALHASPEEVNPKGQLQEILQSLAPEAPRYRIFHESGADHQREFHAEVAWKCQVLGTGKGQSKKEAEIRAAAQALRTRLWQAPAG